MTQVFACCQYDFTPFIATDAGLGRLAPRVVGVLSSIEHSLGVPTRARVSYAVKP